MRRGLFGGFRALRGATGALPLDPTTFEKVDETFILRFAPYASVLITLSTLR